MFTKKNALFKKIKKTIQAPWDIPKSKPDKQWPNKGLVEFSNYSTRYRKGLELVVKNVDVNIKPGEKVILQITKIIKITY